MSALPAFDLVRPSDVAEAVRARGAQPHSRYLAGGTDLIAALRHGLGAPAALIDLSHIAELREVRAEGDWLRIGAGVTLAALERDPLIAAHAPVIARAAATVAAPAHRSAATLGGNLCLDTRCVFYNQGDWWRAAKGFCLKQDGPVCHVAPTGSRCHAAYSGDMAPALMVLQAEIEIAGAAGRRVIALADLYADDGQAHLRLGPAELVVAVRVPIEYGLAADYAKARTRGAIDFPLAGVAVAVRRDGMAAGVLRIALTGTGSRPIPLDGTDELIGRALDEAALMHIDRLVRKQVSPMRTTTTPAHYRRRVASALAVRLVRSLCANAV